MVSAKAADDAAHAEALAQRALEGDTGAQHELVESLWPSWVRQVRASKGMGAMARCDDHVREVATRVAEKIGRKGAHALRLYPLWRDKHPDSDFGDWNRIVVANTVRDYVREQMGSTRLDAGDLSPKRLLNELTRCAALETASVRPPFTMKQAVREVVEFAGAHLPPLQVRAVALWLEGASDADLDRELGTDPGGGRELMRAGVAVLRRKFAGG